MRLKNRRKGRKCHKTSHDLALVSYPFQFEPRHLAHATSRARSRECGTDSRHAASLTVAIMSRLQITRDTAIVGLLGVGPSKDSEDELHKWVTSRLPEIIKEDWEEQLTVLSRKLKLALEDARP